MSKQAKARIKINQLLTESGWHLREQPLVNANKELIGLMEEKMGDWESVAIIMN